MMLICCPSGISGGLILAGSRCPPSHSLTALLSSTAVAHKIKQLMGQSKDQEIICQLSSWAKQTLLGETYFNFFPAEIDSDIDKQRQKSKMHLFPHFFFFTPGLNLTSSFQTPLQPPPPLPQVMQDDGKQGS